MQKNKTTIYIYQNGTYKKLLSTKEEAEKENVSPGAIRMRRYQKHSKYNPLDYIYIKGGWFKIEE